MAEASNGLIVIGENINTTRRIRATSKNIVQEDGKVGWAYTGLDGTKRMLDITDIYPEDPKEVATARIGHIGQGVRKQDIEFLTWAIKSQEAAGATIIDLCVDELSVYPEERHEFMRWIVKTAQSISDVSYAIDSSDPETIMAGLSCGEVSLLGWEILSRACNDFICIPDSLVAPVMRLMAEGGEDDALVAGESAVAGLAGLIAARRSATLSEALGLDERSRVLLFGTEGATDPEIYRAIVGRAPEDIAA